MNYKDRLRWLLTPWIVILCLSIVLIVLNLFIIQHSRPFNSDDVSWQNILLSWRPFEGHTIYLGGSDDYILRIPVFIILGHFFSPSRNLLFVESVIFAIAGFTFFYFAGLYFLKKLKIGLTYINLLPFLWLASFGLQMAQLYLNTNLRSYEIGLSFVFFMFTAMLYFHDINPLKTYAGKLTLLLIALFGGLLIYNDPYFLYFTILPVLIFFTLLFLFKYTDIRKLLIVYSVTLASFVFEKATSFLVIKSGAHLLFSEPIQFVSFDKLFSNIALAINGLLVLFGANFFGRAVVNLITIGAVINFFILAFILYKIYSLKSSLLSVRLEQRSRIIWLSFFGSLSIFVILIYALSNLEVGLPTYRYLVVVAFSATLFLAITLGSLKRMRLLIVGVIILAIAFNLGTSLSDMNKSASQEIGAGNTKNSQNYELISTVKELGLTKGYAPYWDGDINSYLSGGKIEFLPIVCINGRTELLNYLVDTSQFTKPATRSFYIIDPDVNNPPTCTTRQFIKQFGSPNQSLKVDDKTVYIYSRDLF